MSEVKRIGEEYRDAFSRFVAQHPKGHILQTLEWGEVKRGMGWTPLPVALFEDGRITAGIMVLKRRLPIPGLQRCIFYAPRGPVADLHDSARLDRLLAGVRELAREEGAIFLKIDPDVSRDDKDFRDYLTSSGFRRTASAEGFEGVQPTFVFRLDIKPDEEKLLAQMSNKTRYNLRLAEKKGVTVKIGSDLDDLAVFYAILEETARRDRFLIRGFDYFKSIWTHLAAAGMARLFMAQWDGRVIAASLAFILGEKAWYIYGASSNRDRHVMPNYLLQWTMIRWARERGCTLYDFRGVSGNLSPDNPLYGLYRFKRGFAGEFTEFIGEWDLIYQPLEYWLWTRGLPAYSRLVRAWIRRRKERSTNGGEPAAQVD